MASKGVAATAKGVTASVKDAFAQAKAKTVGTTTDTTVTKSAPPKSAPPKVESVEDDYPKDGTGVIRLDPWLEPFQDALRTRYSKAQSWIKSLSETEGGLAEFSKVRTISLTRVLPSRLGDGKGGNGWLIDFGTGLREVRYHRCAEQ